jgi:hypothetical protein
MRLIFLCVWLALAAGQANAQSTPLTPAEVRVAAQAALAGGDLPLAEALARALLDRDPADPVGLAILSQIALGAGATGDAFTFARDLYRSLPPGPDRYVAARIAAFAALQDGRLRTATLWLRRALIDAPDQAAVEQTITDARAVRAQDPWRLSFNFSIAPSDNVNGGSENDTIFVLGFPLRIPVDERALAGVAATYDFGATYRLTETEQRAINLGLRLSGREIWFPSETVDYIREETPTNQSPVTASDFAQTRLTASLTADYALGAGNLGLQSQLSRQFVGHDLEYDSLRLALSYSRPLSEQLALGGGLSLEGRDMADAPDQVRWGVFSRVSYLAADRRRLSALIAWDDVASDQNSVASTALTLELGYAPGRQIGPFDMSFSVGATWTDYDRFVNSLTGPDGRQDQRTYVNATFGLPDVQWAGFSPEIRLGWEQLDSDYFLAERDGVTLDLGVRSSF